MYVLPTCPPVTRPDEETVATLGSAEAQLTLWPLSLLPAESRIVAVAVVVSPTSMRGDAIVTVTVDTGAVLVVAPLSAGASTVTVADPLAKSMCALMLALPGATAVTMPVDDTRATAVFDDAQVGLRPVMVSPNASRAVAFAVAVPPVTIFDGSTVTDIDMAGA